jgi:uncharacterized protein DUF5988
MHPDSRKDICLTERKIPMAQPNVHTESTVLDPNTAEVFLEGGPEGIPRWLVVSREQLADGKVKVPYLAGYEHFVRTITDDARFLFSWSSRTEIAE